MAANGVKEPLLVGLVDSSSSQKSNRTAPKRRRFRRCRSAPIADLVSPHTGDRGLANPHSELIFGYVHPSLKKVTTYLAIYLCIGTICFYLVRHQLTGKKTDGFLDAVYFCIVTMTTVGYGDLVPNSVASKLLACGFVFSGMAIVALILGSAADYLIEKQEILIVKALHMRQKIEPTEILKECKVNKAWYKLFLVSVVLVFLIITGTVFLVVVEGLCFVDAFYCVCSTITTLGYGDESFSTKGGRVFAVFWILSSTIILAQFYLYIAELTTEKRHKALVNWVLTRKITNTDLEAADLDNDGVVGAAEFILYKLKEMGKINQEDISIVLEEFENLDFDQSGSLSVSDITLAQSTQPQY